VGTGEGKREEEKKRGKKEKEEKGDHEGREYHCNRFLCLERASVSGSSL